MKLREGMLPGAVQGVTELLPVRCSAHLVIVRSFLPGFHQPGVRFNVILHLGILLSTVFFFRRKLLGLLQALLSTRRRSTPAVPPSMLSIPTRRRLILHLAIAAAISGIFGVMLESRIQALFQSVAVTAVTLFVNGGPLFITDRTAKDDQAFDAPGAGVSDR